MQRVKVPSPVTVAFIKKISCVRKECYKPTTAMLLSPSYKTIELSTLVDNKKEYKMSFNIYNICILCTPIIALFCT